MPGICRIIGVGSTGLYNPKCAIGYATVLVRIFFGFHLHGGQYNIGGIDGKVKFLGTDARKLKDARYQGWLVGTGIAYGYAWILGRHWNLEAEIGLGYSYTRYDKFRCAGCGKKVETNKPHHYVGPTKAAINLVYLF